MKSGPNENDKLIPEFTKYLRVILGITIIFIGSFSLFHLIFDNPSIKNEQESFFNSFYQTLLIGLGIWMISTRNKKLRRDFSKTRLYRSLFIMIGVILALAAAFFFFD